MKIFPRSIVPCDFGGDEICSDEITGNISTIDFIQLHKIYVIVFDTTQI